jgi:hypothetical protein
VVSTHNACRLPAHVPSQNAAPLGVAYVAAALGLGICLGVDFSKTAKEGEQGLGPDLLSEVRKLPESTWAKDVRDECTSGIAFDERPQAGDWLAIWGGSSATGCVALQLAKLAGLRVVCVLDVARNGARMLKLGADLLVDRLDEERAIEIVRGVTGGNRCLALPSAGAAAHLVGLSGLPKDDIAGVKKHVVPIKAFHEAEPVGEALMEWVEKLLERRLLQTPDIEVAEGGLKGINEALDRLRDGSVNGPRIVVPLQK